MVLLGIVVYWLIGWLLCDISAWEYYSWYSGIWHGLFFPINLLRSFFTDTLYIAPFHSYPYYVLFWITGISTLLSIFDVGHTSGAQSNKNQPKEGEEQEL